MAEKKDQKAAENSNVPAERQEMQVASQMFTGAVLREMASIDNSIQLSAYQKKLAEHLFIQIDTSLKELEAKRLKDGKDSSPYLWANVNMQKLALSAMHRIELELDALIPGTIYPIPYWNGKLKKYDLDLRIGYIGADTYKRKFAIDPPKDIIYELVYSKDKFTVIKKGVDRDVESYRIDIESPFDRGEVVGGFGYIVHEDATKNKLVLVNKKEFDRAKAAGKSGGSFWSTWEDRMQEKTVVLRTLKHVKVDPARVNEGYLDAERDLEDQQDAETKIKEQANTGKVVDITPTGEQKQIEDSKQTEGTKAEDPQTTIERKECPKGGYVTKELCGECKDKTKGCPDWDVPKDGKKAANGKGPGF